MNIYVENPKESTNCLICLFIYLTCLLEYNCFTMVCYFLLYNKVNQLYIYHHTSSLLCLPPILPIPPLQVVTKHRADLPVLCSCFPLAIYFTFGSVYMSMPLSHFIPTYPSPLPVSSSPFSTSASLFLYLDSIHMCQHMVFVFLFLTYFTLYADSRSTHLTTNNSVSFLFMAE